MTETFPKEQTTKRKIEEETPQLLPNAKEIKISQDDTHLCVNCESNTNLKDDISGTKICEECESCPVCLEYFSKKDNKLIRFSDGCSHKFCKSCSDNFLDIKCPMCRYTPKYCRNTDKIDNITLFKEYLKENKLKPLKFYKIIKIISNHSNFNCKKYKEVVKKLYMKYESVETFVIKNFEKQYCSFDYINSKERVSFLRCKFNCNCCIALFKIAEN